jgi:hypothetical protein
MLALVDLFASKTKFFGPPHVILHKAQEHRRIMVRAAAAIESPTFHRGPSIRFAVDDVDRRALLRPDSRPAGRSRRKLILPTCRLCAVWFSRQGLPAQERGDKHILFADVQ